MKILFIDSCIRGENSRTYMICKEFIECYKHINPSDEIIRLDLKNMSLSGHTAEELIYRDQLIAKGKYDDSMFSLAHQFAGSDKIIVGAPYWDLSFPSLLKVYFENICVSGITFISEDNRLKGICRGQKLVYITTAGNKIGDFDLGQKYVRSLCCGMLGIREFTDVTAEEMDMDYSDTAVIMSDALQRARQLAAIW